MKEFNMKREAEFDRVRRLTKKQAIDEKWVIIPKPPENVVWEQYDVVWMKGVGDVTARKLHELGIDTVGDAKRTFEKHCHLFSAKIKNDILHGIQNVQGK